MLYADNKNTFKIEKWEVDPLYNSIRQGDTFFEIEPKAMEVLVYLAKHAGRTVGTLELQKAVWPNQEVSVSAVNRIISNLRRCFGDNPKSPSYIMTIKNMGYRLIAKVTPREYFSQDSESSEISKPSNTQRFIYPFITLFSITLLVLMYLYPAKQSEEKFETRYITSDKFAESGLSLSPDGEKIVYDRTIYSKKNANDHSSFLFMKHIESNETIQLTHSKGFASHPVWSPDNRTVVFAHESTLSDKQINYQIYAIDTQTKQTEVLTKTLGHPHGLSWSPDGQYILFADGPSTKFNALTRLNIENKEKQIIPNHSNSNDYYSYPSYSPNGKLIAVIRTDQGMHDNIDLINTENYSAKTIIRNYQKISSLTWKDNDTLFIAAGDVASSQLLEFSISTRKSKIINIEDTHIEYLSYSQNTQKLAFESIDTPYNIYYIDYSPKSSTYQLSAGALTNLSRQELEAAQSPDGRYTAIISSRSGALEIWLKDSSDGQSRKLTDIKANNIRGLDWSPHSDKLAFVATVDHKTALYWIFVSNKQLHKFSQDNHNYSLVGWENEDASILFSSNNNNEKWKLWRLYTNTHDIEIVSNEPITQGRLSPDRNMIYFIKYKHPGIWGSRLSNIEPTLVPRTESMSIYRSWVVADKGIYYALYGNIGDYDYLYFQSFKGSKPVLVEKIKGLYMNRIHWSNHRILISVYDDRSSDIGIIDGL